MLELVGGGSLLLVCALVDARLPARGRAAAATGRSLGFGSVTWKVTLDEALASIRLGLGTSSKRQRLIMTECASSEATTAAQMPWGLELTQSLVGITTNSTNSSSRLIDSTPARKSRILGSQSTAVSW